MLLWNEMLKQSKGHPKQMRIRRLVVRSQFFDLQVASSNLVPAEDLLAGVQSCLVLISSSTDGVMIPRKPLSGWWFGTCFTFPYIGNNHPN